MGKMTALIPIVFGFGLILSLGGVVQAVEGPQSQLFNFQIGSVDEDVYPQNEHDHNSYGGNKGHHGKGGGGILSSLLGGLWGGGGSKSKRGGLGSYYSSSGGGEDGSILGFQPEYAGGRLANGIRTGGGFSSGEQFNNVQGGGVRGGYPTSQTQSQGNTQSQNNENQNEGQGGNTNFHHSPILGPMPHGLPKFRPQNYRPQSSGNGGGRGQNQNGVGKQKEEKRVEPVPTTQATLSSGSGSSQQQQQGVNTNGGQAVAVGQPTLSPGLIRTNELMSEGEKLGYKPGPPPGYKEFSYGQLYSPRPPKRSRFPSILSSLFSWGDENDHHAHESEDSPRHPPSPQPPKGGGPRGTGGYYSGQSGPSGSASEPLPVRIGNTIMGLFGGSLTQHSHRPHDHHQQPEEFKRRRQPGGYQSTASSSHFYSILPQEFTGPSQSRPTRGQNKQRPPPTLASRPEIPFPSLTHGLRRSVIVEVPQYVY